MTTAFGAEFEELIGRFAVEHEMIPKAEDLRSTRFLARSVVPHVQKLSALFNRLEREQSDSLDPYWKESSNRANMRLAYFLYFMPSNLYRVASVITELSRLGFRWNAETRDRLKGIEFGAGPASGACGVAAGEKFGPIGLPESGDWALIEQEKAMLMLGADWAQEYFGATGRPDWGVRTFHRKIDLSKGLLPPTAPRFNLWVMSYYLNELSDSPAKIARALLQSWEKHLENEGIVILVEPALKEQSRKLLELRRELLAERDRQGIEWLQLLTPCLGHQACGALAAEDDWCHEEVSWWRPPYFRTIDEMASLDRKSLPFSYLVLARSRRSREELLPALGGAGARHRLVSPAHFEGKEQEFFVCGEEGKRRARYRAGEGEAPLERGDVLIGAQIRGDTHASRIEKIKDRK